MTSFQTLLPDFICDAIAAQGYRPTGILHQLNSYENRVYEVPLEDKTSLVTKFYRPSRWSLDTLIDEHQTLKALQDAEVPVVRPVVLPHNTGFETLGFAEPYYFCCYKKFGGRMEQDLAPDQLMWLGRTLGRLHNVTEHLTLHHRLPLNTNTYGDQQLKTILDGRYVPEDLRNHLEDVLHRCLDFMEPLMSLDWHAFAVHGDCHLGNVLWDRIGPTLVDFDDMVMAPAVQDVWMLLYGTALEQAEQKKSFLKGYEVFRKFDQHSFCLVEPLRTLRMIRHAAWIGERFEEEIFKRTFPYYPERKYWEGFLLSMKEQWSLLQEA